MRRQDNGPYPTLSEIFFKNCKKRNYFVYVPIKPFVLKGDFSLWDFSSVCWTNNIQFWASTKVVRGGLSTFGYVVAGTEKPFTKLSTSCQSCQRHCYYPTRTFIICLNIMKSRQQKRLLGEKTCQFYLREIQFRNNGIASNLKNVILNQDLFLNLNIILSRLNG